MQIQQPLSESVPCGKRIAQVFPGVRVNQPPHCQIAESQRDLDGVIRCLAGLNVGDLVSRKAASHRVRELRCREDDASTLDDDRLGRERSVQLIPVDEHATRHGNHHDIKADADARPEMDLEKELAQEQALRLTDPTLPGGHGDDFLARSNRWGEALAEGRNVRLLIHQTQGFREELLSRDTIRPGRSREENRT